MQWTRIRRENSASIFSIENWTETEKEIETSRGKKGPVSIKTRPKWPQQSVPASTTALSANVRRHKSGVNLIFSINNTGRPHKPQNSQKKREKFRSTNKKWFHSCGAISLSKKSEKQSSPGRKTGAKMKRLIKTTVKKTGRFGAIS